MVQNGNFNEISIREARAICDNLQIGDIVVLDERMANTRYLNDKFFFTQISDDNESNREFYTSGQYTRYISRVLPDRRTKVVDISQKDCSIRIALDGDDQMWISYGCIDYLETKRINEAVNRNPDKFPERFSFLLESYNLLENKRKSKKIYDSMKNDY